MNLRVLLARGCVWGKGGRGLWRNVVTIELRVNGELQLILSPEDNFELAMLQEMASRAQKGAPLRLTTAGDFFVVAVEK